VKFIVDAQLPPKLADWLRDHGHDAVAVRQIGLREAEDRAIWAYAVQEGAIIVTKDEDFARLAATHATGPALIWVRMGNVVNRVLLARFEEAWPEICGHLAAGTRIVEMY